MNLKKAAVFEETYNAYIHQLKSVDIKMHASTLGARIDGNALWIRFYNEDYKVSEKGVFDIHENRANFAISVVLCRYILDCPKVLPEKGSWVSYREFKDAGPLVGYFTANTNKIIEQTFTQRVTDLITSAAVLGGTPFNDGSDYDLSMEFSLLPKIPILLKFNDRDDEFPAQCTILFRKSAEEYLDMESLSIGGTFLAGNLIRNIS